MSYRTALAIVLCLCGLAALPATASAAAPTIPLTTLSHTTTTSTTLEADLNPQGKATKYHFEYGSEDCSTNPCASTPEVQIPAGNAPVRVSAPIEGLTPGTTYHFRVLATHKEEAAVESPDRTFTTFAPPQVFKPCPNDAFRTDLPSAHLPDCRAYEQASPLDKNGGDVWSNGEYLAAAAGRVLFLNDGGLPGAVGSQAYGGLYLANRGAEGWTTEGLYPPPSLGDTARAKGWLPDLSDFFIEAGKQLGENNEQVAVYARAEDGQFTTIAPEAPILEAEYAYAGASADGSVVLFESIASLTPTAATGKRNLYVWDRATGKLHLAGALNGPGEEGTAPSAGAFAGPYNWFEGASPRTLSEGGARDNYYTQEPGAISADGKAIYFTASGSARLYLRQNPTQPQSALDGQGNCTEAAKACTVMVNATEKTNGPGGGPDPAGSRPAAFLGASADGTKALFSSSEKLTNDANTGPEQKPATIERADRNGANVAPSLVMTHGTAIAVDSEHIYWVDLETSAIARAKLDGTGVENQFITATKDPKGVAVISGEIYWTNAAGEAKEEDGTTKVTEGTIGRAKLNGEGPASEVEQDFIEGAGNPHAVTADAEHVFWTNDPVAESTQGFVGRAAIGGGEVNPKLVKDFLALEEMPGIAVDGEHVYWMDTNTPGTSHFSRISRANLDGTGYLEEEVNNISFIFLGEGVEGKGLAVEGNQIYWSQHASETIGRAKLNGEAPASEEEAELISGANHPQGVALDATHIYWSSNGESPPNPGNDLYRFDSTKPAGQRLTDLALDAADTNGAEVQGVLGTSDDGSTVYFAANAVLAPGATQGDCKGGPNGKGSCNIYLSQGGQLHFVARVPEYYMEGSVDWRPTNTTSNSNITLVPRESRVSPDGSVLLYAREGQLYRFDAQTLISTCVSCSPTGESDGGFRAIRQPEFFEPPHPEPSFSSGVLSEDGSRVFFETTAALAPEDTNGHGGCPTVGYPQYRACQDVYEWEAEVKGSCEIPGGCHYLLSSGTDSEPSFFAGASASGDEVYIYTRARLVGQDTDAQRDVYDVRVGGGLASQYPKAPTVCEAESCKGPAPQAPPIPSAGSAGLLAPGNPRPNRNSCPKPRVKKHGKCVVKHPKSKAKKRPKHSKQRSHR